MTPSSGFGRRRAPSSTSLQTVTPRDARGGHEGRLARDAGALDQQVHVVDERGVLRAQDDFDAARAKPPASSSLVPVDADDPHPAARERERRRLARAGEAEDEGRAQEANSDA